MSLPCLVNIQLSMKSISLKIFISVCILIVMHVAPDGLQSARYTDTVRALVDLGTFALPKDLPHHVDVVQINGQLYSVIAPGLPIILAPLYWVYSKKHQSLVNQ